MCMFVRAKKGDKYACAKVKLMSEGFQVSSFVPQRNVEVVDAFKLFVLHAHYCLCTF